MAAGIVGVAPVGNRVGNERGERTKKREVRPEAMANSEVCAVKLPCSARPEALSWIGRTPQIEIDNLGPVNGGKSDDVASLCGKRVPAANGYKVLVGERPLIGGCGFHEAFDENCVTGKGAGSGRNVGGRWHVASLAHKEIVACDRHGRFVWAPLLSQVACEA